MSPSATQVGHKKGRLRHWNTWQVTCLPRPSTLSQHHVNLYVWSVEVTAATTISLWHCCFVREAMWIWWRRLSLFLYVYTRQCRRFDTNVWKSVESKVVGVARLVGGPRSAIPSLFSSCNDFQTPTISESTTRHKVTRLPFSRLLSSLNFIVTLFHTCITVYNWKTIETLTVRQEITQNVSRREWDMIYTRNN